MTRSWFRLVIRVLVPVAGLLLAGFLIALSARDVDWNLLSETLIGIEPAPAALALMSLLALYLVHARRWAFIIPAEHSLKMPDVFPAVMIGYLMNTITPLRLGDLARSTVLSRSHRIPIGRLMGSIFAEHLFDALMRVLVVAIFALFIPVPTAARTALLVGSGAGIVAGVFVMTLVPERFDKLRVFARPFGRFGDKVFGIAVEFNLGFNSLREGRRVLGGGVLTLAVWFLMFTYAILLAHSLGLDLPWYAPIFALSLAGLGAAIPGSPAAIGVFQIAVVAGLSVWSGDATSVLAYAFAVHAFQLILNVLIGGSMAIRTGYMSSRGRSAGSRHASESDE